MKHKYLLIPRGANCAREDSVFFVYLGKSKNDKKVLNRIQMIAMESGAYFKKWSDDVATTFHNQSRSLFPNALLPSLRRNVIKLNATQLNARLNQGTIFDNLIEDSVCPSGAFYALSMLDSEFNFNQSSKTGATPSHVKNLSDIEVSPVLACVLMFFVVFGGLLLGAWVDGHSPF